MHCCYYSMEQYRPSQHKVLFHFQKETTLVQIILHPATSLRLQDQVTQMVKSRTLIYVNITLIFIFKAMIYTLTNKFKIYCLRQGREIETTIRVDPMLQTNSGLINMYLYIAILFVHMCCLKTHEPYIGICSK